MLLNYVRAVKTLRLFHQTPVIVRFPVPSTHWKHNPWARNEVVTTRTCPIASHCLTTKCKIIVKFLFSYSIKHGWWQFIIAWFGIDTLNSFFFVLEFFARFPRIFLAANQLSNVTGLVFSKRKSKLDRKNKSLCTKSRNKVVAIKMGLQLLLQLLLPILLTPLQQYIYYCRSVHPTHILGCIP